MRKILFIIAILLMLPLMLPQLAHSSELVKDAVPQAQPVGEGRMTWLFWDVYDARLYAPQGEFKEGKPFALSLTYLRDIAGRDIADRSAEEMRRLGVQDEVKLATWHSQMRNIFPDVAEGKNITGIYDTNGVSIFYADETEIGRVNDPEFGEYFFNIWLSEQTRDPSLRAQLLGMR